VATYTENKDFKREVLQFHNHHFTALVQYHIKNCFIKKDMTCNKQRE